MSFLLRTPTRAIGSSVMSGIGRNSHRAFSAAPARFSGKEDGLHDPQRAEIVERKVKESVETRQWKDELASNSEAIVKAERNEVKSSQEHIKELQKETAQMAKKAASVSR